MLLLNKFIDTSAIFLDGLLEVPEKITSSIPDPLILLADVSPMHHLNDSTIFDFPQPFGPTIPVKPFSIRKFVFSANDLNPKSWIFLNSIHKVISVFLNIFSNFYKLKLFRTFCLI